MTLKTKELLSSGFLGVFWIMIGFGQLFNKDRTLGGIAIILMIISLIATILPYFLKSESEDEMSIINREKAKSNVFVFLFISLMFCAMVSIIMEGLVVDLRLTVPFLVGGVSLMKFIFFTFYEKFGV